MPDLDVVIAGGPDDEYAQLIAEAVPARVETTDERSLLALNYTSGTTGTPKGVMYQHRGAYLQALAMVAQAELRPGSVFLWTLPMFHCNGWCFPWAVTAAGGTHVELRQRRAGSDLARHPQRGRHSFQRSTDRADSARIRAVGRRGSGSVADPGR